MFRKWLAIGLVILLVSSFVIAIGCSSEDDMVGVWKKQADPSQHYTLTSDGKFTVLYKDGTTLMTGQGNWEVDDDEITFTYTNSTTYMGDATVTGTVDGDEFTDEDSAVWVKE